MKTLVIHPKDSTTEFLSVLYEGKGYTVVTNWTISLTSILKQIRKHDRIMMMGHGSPRGLLGLQKIFMDKKFINLIRKKECVCIWCHADKYVLHKQIYGFYTGMFISEVGEANFYGIETTQNEVDYSNFLFVNLMKDIIESPNILNEIKTSYIGDSPIISYNNERLYYRTKEDVLKYEKSLEDDFVEKYLII